jgi:hypothetical protein
VQPNLKPLAATLCVLLAACAEHELRQDRPVPLAGSIDRIAPCTMQQLTAAGYGPPGLTFRPYVGRPRSEIVYRAVPSFAPGVGMQLLSIELVQTSPGNATAALRPSGIGGTAVAEAAMIALQSCQGS